MGATAGSAGASVGNAGFVRTVLRTLKRPPGLGLGAGLDVDVGEDPWGAGLEVGWDVCVECELPWELGWEMPSRRRLNEECSLREG